MLEPAYTSPTECRPAAHEGEMVRRPQYAKVHSQPGALTAPTQTTGSSARTHTWKTEVGVERAMLRARERSREVDMEVDEDASGESQRLALKALAEDEACQRRERLTNESDDLPEPPKPPDDPAQRRTESPSVELEGESRAASSCDIESVEGEADMLGAPGRDEDDWK